MPDAILTLTRPLLVFDLETTGIAPATDRIWEIGIVKVYPDGTEKEWESLVNPGVPIPPEVQEATKNERWPNGITNKDLENAPPFKDIAPIVAKGFEGCDICGYNSRGFDVPLLTVELRRAGFPMDLSNAKHIDAFKIYQKVRPRNLTDFIRHYLGEEFASQAHSALPDARGTWRALKACLAKHPEIPRTPEEIHAVLYERDGDLLCGGKFIFIGGEVMVNFGKWKDKPLKKMVLNDRRYTEWCIAPAQTFDPEVKKLLLNALSGVFPERNQ